MNKGKIVQVVGAVVDVEFPESLPAIHNATPWAYLAPDIQYVVGAHPSRPAVVPGMRLRLSF